MRIWHQCHPHLDCVVPGLLQKLSVVQHWRNYVSITRILLSEKGQDTVADDTEAAFSVC